MHKKKLYLFTSILSIKPGDTVFIGSDLMPFWAIGVSEEHIDSDQSGDGHKIITVDLEPIADTSVEQYIGGYYATKI